jgi:hypothetical protein
VLGYSNHSQRSLFASVGLKTATWTGRAKIMILGSGIMGMLFVFLFFRVKGRRPPRTDDCIQDVYLKFCRKLDRIGVKRKPSQGPLDFAATAIALRNDLKTSVLNIVKLYISLRYAGNDRKDEFRRLKALVRQFKP